MRPLPTAAGAASQVSAFTWPLTSGSSFPSRPLPQPSPTGAAPADIMPATSSAALSSLTTPLQTISLAAGSDSAGMAGSGAYGGRLLLHGRAGQPGQPGQAMGGALLPLGAGGAGDAGDGPANAYGPAAAMDEIQAGGGGDSDAGRRRRESESDLAAMSAVAARAQWLWDNPLPAAPARHGPAAAAAAAVSCSDWRAVAEASESAGGAAGGGWGGEEARLVDRLWAAGWAGRRALVPPPHAHRDIPLTLETATLHIPCPASPPEPRSVYNTIIHTGGFFLSGRTPEGRGRERSGGNRVSW
jgi:hypothetical protein